MSAIAGIVNFNGAPIEIEQLGLLGQSLEQWGPDGGRDVRQKSVGIVYRAFHTNLESRSESQPLVHPNGSVLAWDGRLDNREELIGLLHDELREDRSDSALVMAAYNKWGVTFPHRIIGDFALSLWDPSTKTLLLARDPVGARLLFYRSDNERLIWSSRIESLLRLPDIRLEVSDEYIAGYLTTRPTQGITPYQSIHTVPPGNTLVAQNGRIYLKRYWVLDPTGEIRYRTDREYEEHFLHLFSEAIRARLRVDGPVWADLSGGLDSSSIVCVADEILAKDPIQTNSLETVSAVFDESPSSDERRFISIVEKKRGQPGHHFSESEYPLVTESFSGDIRPIPNPIEVWSEYHKGVRRQMRTVGARVLLCGIGGDELLTSSPDPSPELTDLFVQLKFGNLHQRLQTWSLALKKPYSEVLLNHTVIPSLPRGLQRLHRRRERSKPLALLQTQFVKQFDLRDKLLGPKDIFGFRQPSSRGQSIAFLSVMDVISSGHLLAWDPIEMSYPFTHRPLVEFLQGIPPTQWIRPGETRSLLRRALRSYLPPEIAMRKGKGCPAEATFRAVAREWPRLQRLLKDPLVCARGYVDSRALKSLIDQPTFGCNPDGLSVIRISYLELWLRDLERRAQTIEQRSRVELSQSVSREREGNAAGLSVGAA